MANLRFYRMNGLGNDFVVLDARQADVSGVAKDRIRMLADRRSGLGCDQVILLKPSSRADVGMRIWNADGSEVAACGNASRCVAWLVADETGRSAVTIETPAGILAANVNGREQVTIDMGSPRFLAAEIPVSAPIADTNSVDLDPALGLGPASLVNVGNPHAIFWVGRVEDVDLAAIGPGLEHHALFPERANISVAEVASPRVIRLRTWERGAGLTQACGTAACAVAVAAARRGYTERNVEVKLAGGALSIAWTSGNRVLMAGPAALDGTGEIDLTRDSVRSS